jgi:hypothetical protein
MGSLSGGTRIPYTFSHFHPQSYFHIYVESFPSCSNLSGLPSAHQLVLVES